MRSGLGALVLAAACLVAGVSRAEPGSGYPELAGNVVNYEYVDFGGFHVRVADGAMVWRGYVGFFEGIVSRVEPRFSRVADNLFFVSWPTVGENGDNVVWNFDEMTVFAHLGGGNAFRMIHGVIHCRNTDACVVPPNEPMPPAQRRQKLMENVRQRGFESPQDALGPTGEMGPASVIGTDDLSGKTLVYRTPAGPMALRFEGPEILVSRQGSAPETHQLHATRVAEGVYFISWGGPFGGNHLVLNAGTMQVYDHIQDDGSRVETIHRASCFGERGTCQQVE